MPGDFLRGRWLRVVLDAGRVEADGPNGRTSSPRSVLGLEVGPGLEVPVVTLRRDRADRPAVVRDLNLPPYCGDGELIRSVQTVCRVKEQRVLSSPDFARRRSPSRRTCMTSLFASWICAVTISGFTGGSADTAWQTVRVWLPSSFDQAACPPSGLGGWKPLAGSDCSWWLRRRLEP